MHRFRSRHFILLYVLIPVLSMVMHLHVFNRDLVGYHVWRQTETQNNIENFAHSDFNILNPAVNNGGNGNGVCRLEFPLMQWIIACFYKIFGDHIIISRIFEFVAGLFSVWGIYYLAFSIFKRVSVSIIAAWCFNFSPLFYYYTLNPMPDNFALCFAIWGMYFFFRWVREQKTIHLICSAAMLSAATMVKMPFVVYLTAVCAYLLSGMIRREIKTNTIIHILITFTCFFLPAVAWYGFVIAGWQTGGGVVTGILTAKKSEIPTLIYKLQGNLISTLPEMLINYGALLFFFAGWIYIVKKRLYQSRLFHILFWWGMGVLFYFIYELNIIGTVHDYYLYPFLPLIFLIVAYGAEQLLSIRAFSMKAIVLISLCILPLTAYLRINHRWNTTDPGFNPDLFTYRYKLAAAAPDTALCIVGNDESGNIWFYYIRKKGWNFDLDTLNGIDVNRLIMKGAKYLYTDSPKVYGNTGVKPYFSALVLQAGSIRVYALSEPKSNNQN